MSDPKCALPLITSDPKYVNPSPAPGRPRGYPQSYPRTGHVQMPPPYSSQPSLLQPGFLGGCLAALCCCFLLDECCCCDM